MDFFSLGFVYGLYEKLHKDFINWLLSIKKKVVIKKIFSPTEIKNWDFSEKYRHEGINHIVKEVKIPFTEKAILPATLECYQC